MLRISRGTLNGHRSAGFTTGADRRRRGSADYPKNVPRTRCPRFDEFPDLERRASLWDRTKRAAHGHPSQKRVEFPRGPPGRDHWSSLREALSVVCPILLSVDHSTAFTSSPKPWYMMPTARTTAGDELTIVPRTLEMPVRFVMRLPLLLLLLGIVPVAPAMAGDIHELQAVRKIERLGVATSSGTRSCRANPFARSIAKPTANSLIRILRCSNPLSSSRPSI